MVDDMAIRTLCRGRSIRDGDVLVLTRLRPGANEFEVVHLVVHCPHPDQCLESLHLPGERQEKSVEGKRLLLCWNGVLRSICIHCTFGHRRNHRRSRRQTSSTRTNIRRLRCEEYAEFEFPSSQRHTMFARSVLRSAAPLRQVSLQSLHDLQ